MQVMIFARGWTALGNKILSLYDKSVIPDMKINKMEWSSVQAGTDARKDVTKSVFPVCKSDESLRVKDRRKYLSLKIMRNNLRTLGLRCFLFFVKSTTMRLQPYNELMPVGGRRHRWQSLGNDPYFILFPTSPTLMRQGGWFHLEYDFACKEQVIQHIYIDYGIGYQSDVAVIHQAEQSGHATIPIFLPTTTRGIRLDPMSAPAEFTLKNARLVKQDSSNSIDRANQYLQTIDRLSFYLTSMGQTDRSLEGDYEWVSHGIDPCFYARPKYPANRCAGWYLITLSIDNGWGEGDAKLYVDMGDDFNEKDSVAMPFENGSSVQRVVRFDRDVIEFRFDPQEIKGAYSIHDLKLEALDEKLAADAMLQRVIECHADFEGLSKIESESAIKGMIVSSPNDHWLDALLSIYGETFILKGDLTNRKLKYWEWIEHVESDRWPDGSQIDSFLDQPDGLPLISVILPVYNTPERLLRDCIESVCSQSYPYWELCITDDASTLAHVEQVLTDYGKRDDRIKIISRKYNGHISKASNSALTVAQGDYVALLDHDDLLSPHALYFMAKAIQENPGAAILYSDEDKIDGEGNRFEPHFKCDWNLDLFLSQNYISHLGVYKMETLELVGGFREGVEGSQDQDLLLRCLHLIQPDDIVHVPHVLYHWRALEGSTALATEEKGYTTNAGVIALQDYVNDQGLQGARVSQGLAPNTYRIQWPLPSEPLVSLLIPTRDRREITELAVRSILDKTVYQNYEIIIIDNGSVETETLEFFRSIQKSDTRVRVISYDLPFNYSAINNFGARHANGDVLGLINNDVEVISADWLTEMVSHALRRDVGCVGAKLFYSDDTIQHAGVIIGLGGVAGHSHKHFPRQAAGYFNRLKLVQSLSAVTAACLLVRREIYDELGGLNEEHLKVAFNDVDFCLRVRESGYRNVWTPYAELYHHESVSRGHEDTPEKVERFAKEVEYMKARWGNVLVSDPYYSPHLTRAREDFSIGGPSV